MEISCKYVNDYISKIKSGETPASKEIHQAVKLVEETLGDKNVYIDSEKTETAIELIEKYFEITFLDWECFVTAMIHCFYKDSGRPVFTEIFIMMGRGNGKNGFISGISWYLTTPNHGIKGYNVDILANAESQAKTSFGDIYEMLERNWSKLQRHYYKSKELIKCIKTGSTIQFNTSNAKSKDSKRSGCLIFDEVHGYESFETINTFMSGLGKVAHGRIFYITTNGHVREGVLDDRVNLSKDVLDGKEKGRGMLPLIYKMDNDEEVDHPELWIKANPSINHFPELKNKIQNEYNDIKRDKKYALEFYTKRMNLPRSDLEVAVTEWENVVATNKPLPDLAGQSCICGIDYASVRDFASVNLHFKIGDERYDINHSWICLQSPDLWRIKAPWKDWVNEGHITAVDEKEISPTLLAEWIAKKSSIYNIRKIYMDNNRYALVTNALREVGFDRDIWGNVKCVRPNDISIVIPIIESAFLNHLIVWGDSPPLRWATGNTKQLVRGKKEGTDTGNRYYAKIEGKSRKTDPFMAFVHAFAGESELDNSVMYKIPDGGIIQ